MKKYDLPLLLSKYSVVVCLAARIALVLYCVFGNNTQFLALADVLFIALFAIELFLNGLYFVCAINKAIEKKISTICNVGGVWKNTAFPPFYSFLNMFSLFLFYSVHGLSTIFKVLVIVVTDFCISMMHIKSEEMIKDERSKSKRIE